MKIINQKHQLNKKSLNLHPTKRHEAKKKRF